VVAVSHDPATDSRPSVALLRRALLRLTLDDIAGLASPWWPLLSTAANASSIAYAGETQQLAVAVERNRLTTPTTSSPALSFIRNPSLCHVAFTQGHLAASWAAHSAAGGGGPPPLAARSALAAAAALEWVGLLQYFKFDGNYYLLGRTLGISAPMMAWNAAGAVPLFLSFATAGVVLFGAGNERFDGLPAAAVTLFAVANGDVVRETSQVALAAEGGNWAWGAVSQGERRTGSQHTWAGWNGSRNAAAARACGTPCAAWELPQHPITAVSTV
jgi:hypothetical protein